MKFEERLKQFETCLSATTLPEAFMDDAKWLVTRTKALAKEAAEAAKLEKLLTKYRQERNTALDLEPTSKIKKDFREALSNIGINETRFLVDYYYQSQKYRTASANQAKALYKSDEPGDFVEWMMDRHLAMEKEIWRVLDKWTEDQPISVWAKSIVGIGPVISAGLLAHIDITKAPTVGHIWRFAGLDPTRKWVKKTKRPWNAKLKTLCWKTGESFVKVCNNDDDVYGKVYAKRKEQEIILNNEHRFADQAKYKLESFDIGKDTEAYGWYVKGMLPPDHIHSRAKRYAVKLFLSGYHEVAHYLHYGVLPPRPYVIDHLGHVHYFGPPNLDMIPGIRDAKRLGQ